MGSPGGISRRALLASTPALAGGLVMAPRATAAPVPAPFPQPPLIRSTNGVLSTTLRVAFTRGVLPGVGNVDLCNRWTDGPARRVRPAPMIVPIEIVSIAIPS